MAERFNTVTSKATVPEVPGVNFGTGGAKALDAVAKLLYGVSVHIDDDLDNRAKIEGARKGAIDGLAAGTYADKDGRIVSTGKLNQRLLYAPTIAGEAYTESALSHYRNKVELDARIKMTELFVNNPTDPTVIETKAKAYLVGVTDGMPEEIKPLFARQFSIMSAPYIAKADEARMGIAKAGQEGVAEALENTIKQNAVGFATGFFDKNIIVSARSRGALFEMRNALIQRYEAKITDRKGNKIPAFSPKKKVEALAAFDQMITKSAYQGWFTEHLKDDRAVEALEAFRDGAHPKFSIVAVNDAGEYEAAEVLLEPKARQALIKEFIAGIKFANGEEDRTIKEGDRIIKDYSELTFRAFLQAGLPSKKLRLDAAMLDPNILAGTLDKMQKSYVLHQQDGDRDETIIRDTRYKIFTGEITSIEQLPKVGLGKARAGIETLVENREDSSHWSSRKAYKDAERIIHNAAGVIQGSIFLGGAGDERRAKVGSALNTLFLAVREAAKGENFPANFNAPGKGEFDVIKKAIEISDDIFGPGKTNVDPAAEAIKELEERRYKILSQPLRTAEGDREVEEINGKIAVLRQTVASRRRR